MMINSNAWLRSGIPTNTEYTLTIKHVMTLDFENMVSTVVSYTGVIGHKISTLDQ